MGKLVLTNDFINKAIKKHGNTYDYSLVIYERANKEIKIICPEHGVFEQQPTVHLRGSGCLKCFMNHKRKSQDNIIKDFREVHGDIYDYSLVKYKNAHSKVKIICPEHGIFEQAPTNHLKGQKCGKCVGKHMTSDDFIFESLKIHGEKYDYSFSEYKGIKTKVKIICPEHGLFEQTPDKHMRGSGCQVCGGSLKKTKDEWLKIFKEVHADKYDYSLINNESRSKGKISIICSEHGIFEQLIYEHRSGSGCPKCAGKNKDGLEIIDNLKLIHGDRYDYSQLNYSKSSEKLNIICLTHGPFQQLKSNHLKGCGCPKCSFLSSGPQDEIKEFLESLNLDILINERGIIDALELDIFIPSHNLAIEFNGLYWHSELFKDNNYHLNKTIECEKRGIRLIHIFEDEWYDKKDIVKSRLKNILGLTQNKIYGRKCIIKEVSSSESRIFLEENHIQGNVNGKIKLGLYYNNELLSLMTFGSLRKVLGSLPIDGHYELLRFCNKLDTTVIGGANKLLKFFIRNYNPKKIISYADRRWSQGDLYKTLGFEFIDNTQPNYFYIKKYKRENRFKYRKSVLVKEGFDINKSEHQIMLERNINRIYDSGNKKFILSLI